MAPAPRDSKEEETPFNMAMLYYIRLNRRLDEKDIYANRQDMFGWYNALKTIHRNIFFKLTEQEDKDLNEIFVRAETHLQNVGSSHGLAGRQLSMLSLSEASKVMDELDKKIMQLMHAHDMIFPNIKVKGLKMLDEKYGFKGDDK